MAKPAYMDEGEWLAYLAMHPEEDDSPSYTGDDWADQLAAGDTSSSVEDYTDRTTVTNADGSRTQKFDDGSSQTIDASGRVSYTPAPSENLSPEVVQQGNALLNSLTGAAKKAFTKSDGSLDWSALLALAGGAYGFATAKPQDLSGVGFSGTIPEYTAAREQVPYQYDEARRPGSGGRRYLSDVFYGEPDKAEQMKSLARDQARGLAGLQTSSGSMRNSIATPTGVPKAAPKPQPQPQPEEPLYKSLTGQSGAKDIARAYNQFVGVAGGDTQQNQQEAINYLRNLGISDDTMQQAYGAYTSKQFARGGIASLAKGGRYLDGDTNGMADKISTQIDGKDPAALSHGEYVVSADVIAALGGGNNENGAQILDRMMDRVRQQAHGTKKQMRPVDPNKVLPA